MRKLHLTHIAFIFSTALSVALISCQDLSEFDTQQIDQVLQADKIGSSESWGFRLNLIDEGRKVLDLEASYAKFVENNGECGSSSLSACSWCNRCKMPYTLGLIYEEP